MRARSLLPTLLLILAPLQVQAQGYAGLGSEAADYAPVEPGRSFDFPRDHGPHPGFRIEWWYVTANLQDAEGNQYGAQWTLFRQALMPKAGGERWLNGVLWMGHAAVSSADSHFSAERFARGGIGQAGVTLDPFHAFIDDWEMKGSNGPDDAMANLAVRADGEDFSYDLELQTDNPPVLQGDAGYSVKSPEGQASYYYSQPFYEAAGEIVIDGEEIAVTGRAWLDREWSSQPLSGSQEGWDWFALHLPGGEKLMLYQLRGEGGGTYVPGTWISADGTPIPIQPDEAELVPEEWTEVAGREVPTRWRIVLPERGLDIEAEALNPESWMDTTFAYWEGPVTYSGTHEGVGYLEMTGYGGSERGGRE